MPGSSAPGFGDSSENPSGSPGDNPTKYPYTVSIIKLGSVPSETPTKYTNNVTKKFTSAKTSNMLIEYPIEDPTGDPSTMPTGNPSSKPRAQPSSDSDDLKRGIKEAQAILKIDIIFFIIYTISPLSLRHIFTRMSQQGSLIIYHIGVHKLYYETRALLSITSL